MYTADLLSIILVVLEDGPFKVPNSIDIILPTEGTLLLGIDVCFHSMFDICLEVHSSASTFQNL
jgi:hypothetical protein